MTHDDTCTDSLVSALDAALEFITIAPTLNAARGMAHAALNREEYHGHELPDEGAPT